jgi:hypothetical protein
MRVVEITCLALVLIELASGLIHQLKGWPLTGSDLLIVVILIVNYGNLIRWRFDSASARVDELERRLAATGR